MAEATEIMDKVQDTVIDTFETVQEPIVDTIKNVVELVEGYVPDLSDNDVVERLPLVSDVIERQFAFAQRVLDNQHAFVKSIVEAAGPALAKVESRPKPKAARKPSAKSAAA